MKLVRLLSLRIVIFKVCEGGLNSEISSSWLTLFSLVCKKDVHVHLKHVRDIQRESEHISGEISLSNNPAHTVNVLVPFGINASIIPCCKCCQ